MEMSEVHKLWGLHRKGYIFKAYIMFLYPKIIILAYKINSNL